MSNGVTHRRIFSDRKDQRCRRRANKRLISNSRVGLFLTSTILEGDIMPNYVKLYTPLG
jgi:hypothetical protein